MHLASFANLLTLAIGIAIGLMLAPRVEKTAHAQVSNAQSVPPAPTPQSSLGTTSPEQVQPAISAGSMGAFLLLAHHVQSDELVVNGIDMLKLQQGELNLLATIPGVMPQSIQKIVDDAKNTHLYQVASPKPPAQAQPAAKP